MLLFRSIIMFILGTIFGSFGSVRYFRLTDKRDWQIIKSCLIGRSRCQLTGRTLQRYELIPIYSRIKARQQKAISPIYLILELSVGIVFVVTFLALRYSSFFTIGTLIFWLLINRLLTLLIVFDIEKLQLHVPLRIGALCVSLLPQFVGGIGNYHIAFRGSLVFGGIFYVLRRGAKGYMRLKYKQKTDGFGEGDIRLAFLIGTLMPFIFTYQQLSFSATNLIYLFLLFMIGSSLIGILIGYGWKIIRNQTENAHLQFAFIPAMVVAYWILLIRGYDFISRIF